MMKVKDVSVILDMCARNAICPICKYEDCEDCRNQMVEEMGSIVREIVNEAAEGGNQ